MKDYFKLAAQAAVRGAVIGAAAAGTVLFVMAPGASSRRQRAPFMGTNVAHRGLHSRDKSVPENSLEAFRLAAEAGYGIELDVQLSKDGQVVVFHDDTLDRVCGVCARVDELTLAELKALRLCGTEQTIPLFTEVLDVIRGRGPIICELKDGKRNRELCEKTYDIISAYRGEICVESFNPMIVAWFRFHAKDLLRGQLAQPTRFMTRKAFPRRLPSRWGTRFSTAWRARSSSPTASASARCPCAFRSSWAQCASAGRRMSRATRPAATPSSLSSISRG